MARRRLRSVDDVILNILDDFNPPPIMERSLIRTLFFTEVSNYLEEHERSRERIFSEVKRVLENEGYKYMKHGQRWYFERKP